MAAIPATSLQVTGLKDAIDSAVQLTIEKKTIETTIRKSTTTPKWNESFRFFVRLNQACP